MTANGCDVLVVVVCFFDVTCNHKKFRKNENNSLQITCWSLIGVLTSLYYLNIRIFFGGFLADEIRRRIRLAEFFFGGFSAHKIRQRIQLSVAAWGLPHKTVIEFSVDVSGIFDEFSVQCFGTVF